MATNGRTQTLESQWGRPSLTVAAEIPTRALRHKLGRVHVGTDEGELLREIAAAMLRSPDSYSDEQQRQTLEAARWLHAENRAEFAAVMAGRL